MAADAPVPAPVPDAPVPARVEVVNRNPTSGDVGLASKESDTAVMIMNHDIFKRTLHNPPHLFSPNTIYMLTASIYQREPLIKSSTRKREWVEAFLKSAEIYDWQVVAWVVLSNHYHAIIQSPEKPETLSKFTGSYHKYTARRWNEEDKQTGRKVWWNYWDTYIRSERGYYNRLRYIFWNPVKHGLTQNPEEYPFSNYLEFLSNWQVKFNFTDMNEVNDVPEF